MWKKIYWSKCVEKLWGKKIYTLLKKCEEIQTKCVDSTHLVCISFCRKQSQEARNLEENVEKNTDLPDIT